MSQWKKQVMIDALTICGETSNDGMLADLAALKIGDFIWIGDCQLFRQKGGYYDYSFEILLTPPNEQRYKFGVLNFGFRNTDEESNIWPDGGHKVWIKIENRQLYTDTYVNTLHDVMSSLSINFHNITTLDLCHDANFNVSLAVKRRIRNKETTVILNGKVCKDRDSDRDEIDYNTTGSLNRDKYKTIYIKQRKAIKDKTKGVTLTCYDKFKEIKGSQKQYILDYYNNPEKLFRVEIHLNNEQIKQFLSFNNFGSELNILEDNKMREQMFFDFLNRMIRFRKNNEKFDWQRILRWDSGRDSNNPPCQKPKNRPKTKKIKQKNSQLKKPSK